MGIKKLVVYNIFLDCNNWNSNTNISFHKFPLDPILKEKWIKTTGVEKGKLICLVNSNGNLLSRLGINKLKSLFYLN